MKEINYNFMCIYIYGKAAGLYMYKNDLLIKIICILRHTMNTQAQTPHTFSICENPITIQGMWFVPRGNKGRDKRKGNNVVRLKMETEQCEAEWEWLQMSELRATRAKPQTWGEVGRRKIEGWEKERDRESLYYCNSMNIHHHQFISWFHWFLCGCAS